MLEIQLDDALIPLSKDMSMTLATEFPAFSKDTVQRAYSLPFKLNWSDILKAKMGHGNRLDSDLIPPSVETILYFGGDLLLTGILKADDGRSNDETLEVHFMESGRDVIEKLGDVKISSVLTKISIPQTVLPKIIITLNTAAAVPGNLYSLSLNNVVYSYTPTSTQPIEVLQHIKDAINANVPNVATTVNPTPSVVELHIALSDTFSPPFFLTNGFTLVYHKAYALSVYENFKAFVLASLNTPRADLAFNFVNFGDFYKGENSEFNLLGHNFAEKVAGNWQIRENTLRDDKLFYTSYIPFFRLKHVINALAIAAGATGCTSDVDFWADIETALIDNNYALDNVRQDNFYDTTATQNKYLNCFVTEIMPMLHINDMTAKELYDAIANTFNLEYAYEGGKIVFKLKRTPFIDKKQLDITNKTLLNPQRGFKLNKGYTLRHKQDDTEGLAEHAKRIIAEGKEEFVLPIGTLHDWGVFPTVYSKKEGANTAMGTKAFPLRLFFDKGAGTYYMESSNTGDYISLLITPTNGLYEKCFKDWIELLSKGFEITLYALLEAVEFKAIMNREITSIYVATKGGALSAYIKAAEGALTTKEGRVVTKLELLK